MTKFDCYVERLAAKKRAEREEAYNEALLRSLKTRTKAESVAALYNGLTFILGASDVLTAKTAKTLKTSVF